MRAVRYDGANTCFRNFSKALKIYTQFWLENVKKRDRLEHQRRGWEDYITMGFQKYKTKPVSLVHLTQNNTHLYSFVKVVINLLR